MIKTIIDRDPDVLHFFKALGGSKILFAIMLNDVVLNLLVYLLVRYIKTHIQTLIVTEIH